MDARPAGVARRLVVFGAALGVAVGVWPADRPRRIGYLSFYPRPRAGVVPVFDAFFAGMREQGYEEGRDYVMEWRHTGGKQESLDALAVALVADGVDLFFCLTTAAATAAKRATSTIPIVFAGVSDPVTSGLVPSLARPGGNLTGLSSVAPDLEGKRLDILRQIVPTLSRVAVFFNSLNPFHVISIKNAQSAAQVMGLKLQRHDIREAEDLDGAFAAIRNERPDALLILADRVFLHNRKRIMDFTEEQRLPNVNAYKELVEAGGLISYGPSYEDMHKRAAIYVDKILKGANPADLPIEQPAKFTFIVNLKAAKTLGVIVPPSLLALADNVIE